jgi:hypothetical protein
MREKKPDFDADSAVLAACTSAPVCPVHHSERGTLALTEATCWPQPAQVVFPQVLQVTARHIASPSNQNYP